MFPQNCNCFLRKDVLYNLEHELENVEILRWKSLPVPAICPNQTQQGPHSLSLFSSSQCSLLPSFPFSHFFKSQTSTLEHFYSSLALLPLLPDMTSSLSLSSFFFPWSLPSFLAHFLPFCSSPPLTRVSLILFHVSVSLTPIFSSHSPFTTLPFPSSTIAPPPLPLSSEQ